MQLNLVQAVVGSVNTSRVIGRGILTNVRRVR